MKKLKNLKNLKISSSRIKSKVNNILNEDFERKRIYINRRILKTALVAAAAAVFFTATVFAASPSGREMISEVISYFQSSRAVELTDIEELNKYNEEIGASVSNLGYTLTLDNVAADDNFVHIFYTLVSEEPFHEDSIKSKLKGKAADLWEECKINGEYIEDAANNNRYEGYFEDDYTYKGVNKYNVSKMNLPDIFKLEFFVAYLPGFEDILEVQKAIDEGDKSDMLYLSAEIDKSKAKLESDVKITDKRAEGFGVIEKVIFSPFGNQLVLKSEKSDKFAANMFALCDGNGNYIDILSDDFRGEDENGVMTHSVEFSGNMEMNKITMIPIANNQIPIYNMDNYIDNPAGNYPLEYEVNDYGKIIINDIAVYDDRVNISFRTSGYVMNNIMMRLIDSNGNIIEFEEFGVERNYKDGAHTAVFILEDGQRNSEVAGLRVFKQNIELDYENAVTVDLK